MKKVLVTGASGFIGRHSIPFLLDRGYEVHAVSSKVSPKTEKGLPTRWHRADLLDSTQVRELLAKVQPSHLLHLAWYVVPGKFWTSLENLRWVQASLDVFQAFACNGGVRIVAAGTCAEYDWRHDYCSEKETPLVPATLYGASKHSLQLLLDAFARQTELEAAWGRIFLLYGPHEYRERLVPSVICSMLRNESVRCSHGKQVRDFLHVQDVAGAFVALLDSHALGPVNIASASPATLKDVIYKIGAKLDRQDLIQLGALKAPPGDPAVLRADAGRLRDEIGWNPKYNLDTGLQQTIDWWKTQSAEIVVR